MIVPLLDLKKQYQQIKEEIEKKIKEVIESQYFILGPNVTKLEKEIAKYCLTSHSVGVSSGTDALIISLMAANITTSDLVLTTPYTFFATAGSIARVGAIPVFADINPETYNISPESIEAVIDKMDKEQLKKLKAIMPVHLYGQCAQMDPILDIAKKYNLTVIEDAAQAIGAQYKGRKAGSMGDYGCFSFFPSKNLGAFGDGGIVTVNDKELYDKLVMLRMHGSQPKYYHKIIGGNFRLDAIQAAVVSVKLQYLDNWSKKRQENAAKYRELFKTAGLESIINTPLEREDRHIYNQFVISVKEKRDELYKYLTEKQIGTDIYYPVCLHLQECFKYLGYKKTDFPNAEFAAEHTLALPIFPELTNEQLEYVVHSIKKFYL